MKTFKLQDELARRELKKSSLVELVTLYAELALEEQQGFTYSVKSIEQAMNDILDELEKRDYEQGTA